MSSDPSMPASPPSAEPPPAPIDAPVSTLTRLRRWLSPGVRFLPSTDERRCARCGYPFPGGAHGSPAPCSECGALVDPTVARTLRAPVPGRFVQGSLHAPGLTYSVLVGAAVIVLLYSASVPGGYFDPGILGLSAIALLGLFGILRAAVALAVALRQRRLGDTARQPGWWIPPAAVLAAVLAGEAGVPIVLGFEGRRATLEANAAAWHAGTLDQVPVAQGGLKRVGSTPTPILEFPPMSVYADRESASSQQARVQPDDFRGVLLQVSGSGFMFESGAYAYLPYLKSTRLPELVPLGGGWYAVRLRDDW